MFNDNTNFNSKDNISLLWELIIENDQIKYVIQDTSNKRKMYEYYINTLNNFNISSINTNNLLEINKSFISHFMRSLKKHIPSKKINISKAEATDVSLKNKVITIEELHNKRLDEFELNVKKKQEEFNEINKVNIPEQPNFSEKIDEPITEKMEDLVSKVIADRNLIENTIDHSPQILLSQITPDSNSSDETLFNKSEKKVSWGENEEYDNINIINIIRDINRINGRIEKMEDMLSEIHSKIVTNKPINPITIVISDKEIDNIIDDDVCEVAL